MTRPTLTPLEALNKLRESIKDTDAVIHEGFSYILDGPQSCPEELWAPFALHLETDAPFCVTGEIGDPITEESKWLGMDEL